MRQATKGLIATLAIVLVTGFLASPAAAQSSAPGDLATRTPTELGQRVDNYSLWAAQDGFDWGIAAIAGGFVVAIGLGALVVARRHRAGDTPRPLASA